MPDLLIELRSEEIPARMQARAADDLKRLVTDALVERGFLYEGALAFATPRRLALHVAGLPVRGKDVREERRGPRVGAPEAALQGFLKGAGLADIGEARLQSDPKKGDFYVAVIETPGRATIEVLAEIMPGIVRGFPWPKSMRWGAASAQVGSLRWVRPLQSVVALFGPETEEPEIVRFEVDGLKAGDVTAGHRFMAPEPFRVRRLADYASKLQAARVVLDPERRRATILTDARNLAFAQGLELVEDEALLEEVAGLVEWPVVLMGGFDESFLSIPPEVIRATIRQNQKCFVLRRGDALSNRFVLVSNIETRDGGAAVVAGNERVIRARLSDAKFFWETDLRTPLEARLAKLRSVVFHEKLGTQYERVERIAALARELAPLVGAEPDLAERAARLAKADLVTEMVGEFPELQGLMGRYYAIAQGEPASVAAAIEEHYKPVGPSDRVPTDPVSVAVALADKLDTLVGFWAIDEKPTGSKDPYALRRAALGVTRIVLERDVHVSLTKVFERHLSLLLRTLFQSRSFLVSTTDRPDDGLTHEELTDSPDLIGSEHVWTVPREDRAHLPGDPDLAKYAKLMPRVTHTADILSFFADRLKVTLRDQGARHDLVDAVFALPGQDDLLLVVRRVEALGRFLDTEDGRNLLVGYRRAANILRAEEKRDGEGAFEAPPDAGLFALPEERALHDALAGAVPAAQAAVEREEYETAMRALSRLREPVDAFFERVTVNAPEPASRANRLKLLAALREATRAVADFSRIEG